MYPGSRTTAAAGRGGVETDSGGMGKRFTRPYADTPRDERRINAPPTAEGKIQWSALDAIVGMPVLDESRCPQWGVVCEVIVSVALLKRVSGKCNA